MSEAPFPADSEPPKPLLDLRDLAALALAPRWTDVSLALQAQAARSSYVPDPFNTPMAQLIDQQPKVYDYRSGNADGRRIGLSRMHPRDTVLTKGASVRVGDDGGPRVSLARGYGNGRSAAQTGPVLVPPGPPDANVDLNMAETMRHWPPWLLTMVPNKRPWDYKQRNPRYDAFGNFNFGAVTRAAGIPGDIALRGAGWAQRQAGTSRPAFGSTYLGTGSFGDDPEDQYWIEQGRRYDGR
jgi:hypothetical protein